MADPCVCDGNLYLTDTGELCAIPGAIGLRQILIINSTTTFDKATYAWLARVHVLVVGAGGGGGGTEATSSAEVAGGSGGAGGGAAEAIVDESSLLASEAVTIGAAGLGVSGAAGTNGGSTSFGAHAVATGGAGGALGLSTGAGFDAAAVSAGGQGTTGDLLYQGGDGEPGIARGPANPGFALGGASGGSVLAGNFWTNAFLSGWPAGIAAAYQNKGIGGVGAAARPSAAAGRGLDGSKGVVIVALYA